MVKVLIASLVLLAVYNLIFYPVTLGVGLPLFITALHIFLFAVRDKDSKNTVFAVSLSVASILFGVFCAIKSNESIIFANLLLIFFLTFASAFYYKQKTLFSGDTLQFMISPVKTFFEGIISFFDVFSNRELFGFAKKNSKVYGPLLQGLIVAIPIVIVLFLLLLGADPIFRKLAGTLSFSVSERVVVSILVFLGAFFWGLTHVTSDNASSERSWTEERGGRFALSSLVVSGSVALLFAVFLAVQLKYLFLVVAETELVSLGINIATYSEYVRQGFFFLIFASVISAGVIVYILRNLHLIKTVQKKYLQVMISILTLETLLLMISAAKRLVLYVDAHGLSHIRIYGGFFLVWLAAVLLVMLFTTFKKVKHRYEFAALFIVTVSVLVALNIVPIEKIIAVDYPPTVNHEVDTLYIARLNPEAKDAWIPLIAEMGRQQVKLSKVVNPTDEDFRISHVTNGTVYELSKQVYFLDRKYGKSNFIDVADVAKPAGFKVETSWKTFNLSEYEAYQLIRNNREEFEKLKTIYNSIDQLQAQWNALNPTPTPSVPLSQ